VIEVVTGTDADARLNFGTSPFILERGEDMKQARPTKRIKIIHSNISPGKKGGCDLNDGIKSVGGQSCADTVFQDGMGDFDGDDVSEMGEDEGFEDDDDAAADSEAEDTVHEGGFNNMETRRMTMKTMKRRRTQMTRRRMMTPLLVRWTS
jgi:hypothetical protein